MAEFIVPLKRFKGYYASDEGVVYSNHLRKRGNGALTPYLKEGVLYIRIQINKEMHREHLAGLIIEAFTGRRVKSNEEIIHRNSNRADCSLKNITIVKIKEAEKIRQHTHEVFDDNLLKIKLEKLVLYKFSDKNKIILSEGG